MSKNYEDYKPLNPMPPRRRRNPMLSFVQYSIIVLLVFALVVSGVLFMVLHKNTDLDKNGEVIVPPVIDTPEATEPEQPEVTEPDHTEPEGPSATEPPVIDEPTVPTFNHEAYKEVELPKSDINKGNLILVSNNNKVVYPEQKDLISFYGNKSNSYKLSSGNIYIHKDILGVINKMMDDFCAESGKSDIIIWTGYRDEARQTQVYNDYVAQHGEDAALNVVSKPGESDHHTALGIALRVYVDNVSYRLSEIEGYGWIQENCYKYGFVERYPADKIALTGLDYSTSYYIRYVGVPHAELMTQKDLCLEEYVIMLKNYPYGTVHYEFTSEDGSVYEIYYVNGDSDGDTVMVPVPKEGEYTVSGDNINGFIVTVKK